MVKKLIIVSLFMLVFSAFFTLPSELPSASAGVASCNILTSMTTDYNGIRYSTQLKCWQTQTGRLSVRLVQDNVIVSSVEVYGTWTYRTLTNYKYCSRTSYPHKFHLSSWFVSDGRWLYGTGTVKYLNFDCR